MRKRIAWEIDKRLLRRVRIEAAHQNMTQRDLVEAALREWMKNHATQSADA